MKIILMCGGDIGSAALATPLISGLFRNLSHKVDVVTSSLSAPVFTANPAVDKVFCYSVIPRNEKKRRRIQMLFENIKTIFKLVFSRYDAVIIAKEYWDHDALLLSRLARGKIITAVGLDAPILVTHPIDVPRKQEHMAKLLCQLAGPLGFSIDPGPLQIFITKRERKLVTEQFNLSRDLPVFGICLSARKISQRWHIKNFVALMHAIANEINCQFLVFWEKGFSGKSNDPIDELRARRVLHSCSILSPIPVHPDNLRQLIAVLSLCDKIVTTDSDILHLAAGVRTPALFLSGDSTSWFNGPWRFSHQMISTGDLNVNAIKHDEAIGFFTKKNLDLKGFSDDN